jgi:hypothetical protein
MRLGFAIKKEGRKMLILNDILDHQVIGPAILQRQEGRQEISQLLLKRRFGTIPAWVIPRL